MYLYTGFANNLSACPPGLRQDGEGVTLVREDACVTPHRELIEVELDAALLLTRSMDSPATEELAKQMPLALNPLCAHRCTADRETARDHPLPLVVVHREVGVPVEVVKGLRLVDGRGVGAQQ